MSYKNILGLHDLVVHNYGPNKTLASIHVEVPSNLNLIDVHSLIDRIEKDIENTMMIHLVIHIDPIDIHNKESLEIYNTIRSLIKENINEISDIIDFRVVNKNGKNTIFFEIKLKKEFYDKINFDIIDECTKIVLSKYNNFDCKIFKNNTFN